MLYQIHSCGPEFDQTSATEIIHLALDLLIKFFLRYNQQFYNGFDLDQARYFIRPAAGTESYNVASYQKTTIITQ